MAMASTPAARAVSSPLASAWLEITQHDLGRDSPARARPRAAPPCSSRGPRSGPRSRTGARMRSCGARARPPRRPPRPRSAGRQHRRALVRRDDQHEAEPQLKVRRSSCSAIPPASCSQSNTGGSGQAFQSKRGGKALGDGAGRVLDQAAAGDVGAALDQAGLDQRQHGLHVDAGRRQQRLGQASCPSANGAGASQARPDRSTTLRTRE